MFEGKLTQKQRAFAEAIFKGESATNAYVIAGYSANTRMVAGVEGHKLLKNPKISAYLNYLRVQVEEEIIIDHVALLRELNAIALTRINHLVDIETGEPLPLKELTKGHALAAVQEIICEEIAGEHGTKRRRKLKQFSKKEAISELLKIQGYSGELNVAIRTLEAYGIRLRQDTVSEKWFIED